jgi:hypothetical protein
MFINMDRSQHGFKHGFKPTWIPLILNAALLSNMLKCLKLFTK